MRKRDDVDGAFVATSSPGNAVEVAEERGLVEAGKAMLGANRRSKQGVTPARVDDDRSEELVHRSFWIFRAYADDAFLFFDRAEHFPFVTNVGALF